MPFDHAFLYRLSEVADALIAVALLAVILWLALGGVVSAIRHRHDVLDEDENEGSMNRNSSLAE